MANTDLELYQRLNAELSTLVDNFTNLIRASRTGLDDEGGREVARDRRAPGALLEALAEQQLATGHTCVHLVSQLKKGAMLSDFGSLTATSRTTRGAMAAAQAEMEAKLAWMKEDMQAMLNQLETRYYASPHLPQLTPDSDSAGPQLQLSPEVQELYMLALQAPVTGGRADTAAAAAAAAAAAVVGGSDQPPGAAGSLGLG